MVRETPQIQPDVQDATKLREQVGLFLNRLIADREMSEKRLAEAGKRDPMKFVTGRTALDNAIASTQEMLGHMDSMIAEMSCELPVPAALPPRRTTYRLTSRSGVVSTLPAAMRIPVGSVD